jgi:ribosomal protein S18 acetylase RimI-like enzyme
MQLTVNKFRNMLMSNTSIESQNPDLSIAFRSYEPNYRDEICAWVPDESTLKLISGDRGERLEPAILQEWVARSMAAHVLLADSQIVGFATISTSEWPFPAYLAVCEMCHLIIRPDARRLGFGSMMVTSLLHAIRRNGFGAGVARVLPDNLPGLELFNKARWSEKADEWCGKQFRWFLKEC